MPEPALPQIRLRLPRVLRADGDGTIQVQLACAAPVTIRALDVKLHGAIVFTDHRHRGQWRDELIRRVARVEIHDELAVGEHSYPVHLPVDGCVVPSYEGRSLIVYYALEVTVDVPQTRDIKVTLNTDVAISTAPATVEPKTFPDHGQKKPSVGFEVELSSTEVEAGDMLYVAVALPPATRSVARNIVCSLIALESGPDRSGMVCGELDANVRMTWTVPTSIGVADQPIRFSLRMPYGIVPGFAHRAFGLNWRLDVRVDAARTAGPTLAIPLTIVSPTDDAHLSDLVVRSLSSEQRRTLWRRVAQWVGYEYVRGTMITQVYGQPVTIGCVTNGQTSHPVANIAIDCEGLGLGMSGTGRRASFTATDRKQSKLLKKATASATATAYVSTYSDDAIRCVGRPSAAQDPDELKEFAWSVLQLAHAIGRTRATLPAPDFLLPHRDAWKQFAGRVSGEFVPALSSVVFHRDSARWSARIEWGSAGIPKHAVVTARPSEPIDERHHVAWSRASGDFPAGKIEELRALACDTLAIRVSRGAVVARFGPCVDAPDRFSPVVDAVSVAVRALSGRRGVYR